MAGPAGPDLTTIIVSWNTRELLRRCLEALLRGTRRAQEVWVVDNASSDGSAEMVRREFPQVRLIACARNHGFAAANNLALSRSGAALGRHVLLLNPDTEAGPGAVDALADYLDAHDDVGAAGVQLLNPDTSPQRSFDHFWFAHPLRSFLRNHLPGGRETGIVAAPAPAALQVDWIVGACLMLRRAALDQVGWLDEAFHVYGEEVDLQWRLRRAGWRAVLLPRLHVVHHGGQSTQQARREMLLAEYRARGLLVSKHGAPLLRALYPAKAVAELSLEAAAAGARFALGRSPRDRERLLNLGALLLQHLRPSFYRRPSSKK